jgi:hypothetical protein
VKNKLMQFIPILFLVLALFCLSVVPASATGIGVGPSVVTIENALPGQEYLKTIFIYNIDDAENTFSLVASGDIATWVTFFPLDNDTQPINQISIAANDRGYAVVKFSVPPDASPLNYQGQILVTGAKLIDPSPGGAQVQLQMPVEVIIQMTGAPALTVSKTEPAANITPAIPIRSGEMNLISLSYEGEPKVGAVTKLQATVHNLTQKSVKSSLVAEIYLKNELVDTVRSDEVNVPAGIGNTITAYFKPQKAGDYTIKAQVFYEGQQTQQLATQLKVASGSGSGAFPIAAVIGIVVGVVLVAGVILFILNRKKRTT